MYTVHIFFPILCRSRLAHAGENTGGSYDQQRGGTHTRGGSGETLLEKQKRIIAERERKLKKKLDVIKKQREQSDIIDTKGMCQLLQW